MMLWGQFVMLASLALLASSLPIEENSARDKRSPVASRTMMVRGGYMYDRPANSYDPQPQRKAAYTAGCRYNCRQEEEPAAGDAPENGSPAYGAPAQPEEELPVEDAPEEQSPPAREAKAETPAERRPAKDEKGGKRRKSQGPTYTNFFPMMFGNPGGNGRNAGEGGQNPGLATAIANSFSTGKGAIANSHATAFGGGADPSQNKRNSPSRYRV